MSSVASRSSSKPPLPSRWIFSPAARLGRKSAGAAAMTSTSVESNSRPRASASSAAVSTSTRRTPGGAGSETLAATRVTSAPRRAARSARASPIRPEERLPMKRTGSIGSRVPPAETSTRRPSQGPIGPGAACSIASSSARGSGSLPTPCSPREASAPSSGSITVMPRCRSVARLACVAASRYIRSFIAGATSRGAVAGEEGGGDHRVRDPGGELGDRVRRRRSDQVGVRVGDHLEMADRVVLGHGIAREGAARRIALELVDEDRRSDDPLERGPADEALRRRRHQRRGPRAPPWWRGEPAPATCRRRFRRSPRAGCGPSALLGS